MPINFLMKIRSEINTNTWYLTKSSFVVRLTEKLPGLEAYQLRKNCLSDPVLVCIWNSVSLFLLLLYLNEENGSCTFQEWTYGQTRTYVPLICSWIASGLGVC